MVFKLLVLLHAGDTVLFSDNAGDMQHALNVFDEYCKTWQLNVNIKKQNTKIVESKDSGKHEIYP